MRIVTSLILLPFLGIVGCTTPAYFSLPVHRFDSPEARGKAWSGGLEVQHYQPLYFVTVENLHTTPPQGEDVTNHVNDETDSDADEIGLGHFGHGIRLGVARKIDVGFVGSWGSGGGSRLHIKWQFWGEPKIKSQPGNFSMALASNYHSGVLTGNSDDFGDDARYRVRMKAWDFGLIAGYRVEEDFLPYLNFTWVEIDADTEVEQQDNGTTTARYDFRGEGSQGILILGGRSEFKWGGVLSLEWALSRSQWESARNKDFGSIGGMFGWGW